MPETTDTRTQLLDIAEQAVRARGLDGVSYGDLAEAIGIRKASIHYHFPKKADLAVTMMIRYRESFALTRAEIDVSHDTAGARLQAMIDVYRAALNDGKTICLCVALIGSRDTLSVNLLGEVGAFRKEMLAWFESAFKTGARDGTILGIHTAPSEAAGILAQLEGAQLAARAAADVAAFDLSIATLSRRLSG